MIACRERIPDGLKAGVPSSASKGNGRWLGAGVVRGS